jgi:hypothetical protein
VNLINTISGLAIGTSYTVTFYAAFQNDGVGFTVYLDGISQVIAGPALSTSFQQYSFTLTATASTSNLRVKIQSVSIGGPYLLFDAFSVTTAGCVVTS